MDHENELTVILTDGVLRNCVEWTEEDTHQQQIRQTTEERLQEVFSKLRLAIKKECASPAYFLYEISVVPRDGKSKCAQPIKLLAVTDEDEKGEPIVTVMLSHEY